MSTTSIHSYSVAWSDRLIHRVEQLLRDVHFAIGEFYDTNDYPRQVPLKALRAAGEQATTTPAGGPAAEAAHTIDVISPAGSFMLRTMVHKTPFAEDHVHTGLGADIAVTMPSALCSEEDLREGRYLERREAFVQQLAAHLRHMQRVAARKVQAESKQQHGESNEEEEEEEEQQQRHGKAASGAAAARKTAERLQRMDVQLLPIHNCYGCREKTILRLRFRRRQHHNAHPPAHDGMTAGEEKEGGAAQADAPTDYETPYVDVHVRPAMHSARASGAKAVRKHPLYSYLILEDYLMPSHLQRLHQLCVESPGLRRAIVLLKCWALHMGLCAGASGHAEGLNGFLISAMVLFLLEEGVVSAGMTEENAARAVLVYVSNGGFTATSPSSAAGVSSGLPLAEEAGEVPILRLQGDAMNLLFRSSSHFFKLVVEKAAQQALQYPKLSELFGQMPFEPLALRHDVALTIRHCSPAEAEGDGRRISTTSPSTLYFPPAVQLAHKIRSILLTALQSRATEAAVWATGPGTLQVTVCLSSEADGRRRLTRGPPMEDTAAVERFNAFWGSDITSTRQFSDGAIYRCVLWDLPEGLSTTETTQHVLQYALRRHLGQPSVRDQREITVSAFLGGLEGFLKERVGAEWRDAQLLVKVSLWNACKAIQGFMAALPQNAVPCKITSFDIIAPSERHTDVFPVRPHLALTVSTELKRDAPLHEGSETSPAVEDERFLGLSTKPTLEPIHCVLTIDDRRRIPDDLEAIQLMKAAIGAQISKVLQATYGLQSPSSTAAAAADAEAKEEGGMNNKKKATSKSKQQQQQQLSTAAAQPGSATTTSTPVLHASCHPHGVDVAYQGYLFRIYVAHYREVSLLRALQRIPRADMLEMKLFWTVQHAKLLRSIAFGHHTYPMAVRLAKRWVSAMCMYEFVMPEAVELLVAHAYLRSHAASHTTLTNIHLPSGQGAAAAGIAPPKTAASGFLRFIELLATHDWSTPLILPTTDDSVLESEAASSPSGGLPAQSKAAALLRTQQQQKNPQQAMFIASPYAPTASPFTTATPRQMVLHRLVALAKGAHSLLLRHLRHTQQQRAEEVEEVATERQLFQMDPRVFDLALPLHPTAVLHPDRAVQVALASNVPAASPAPGVEEETEEVCGSHPVWRTDLHGSSGLAAAAADAIARPAGVERVWQLDELEPELRARYLTQRIERDPAGDAVRAVRTALRDKAMVFYDALAPSMLYVVALTATPPTARAAWQLAKQVCEAGKGAVLPHPVLLATSESSESSAGPTAGAAGGRPAAGSQRPGGPSRAKFGGRHPPQQGGNNNNNNKKKKKKEEEEVASQVPPVHRSSSSSKSVPNKNGVKRSRAEMEEDDEADTAAAPPAKQRASKKKKKSATRGVSEGE